MCEFGKHERVDSLADWIFQSIGISSMHPSGEYRSLRGWHVREKSVVMTFVVTDCPFTTNGAYVEARGRYRWSGDEKNVYSVHPLPNHSEQVRLGYKHPVPVITLHCNHVNDHHSRCTDNLQWIGLDRYEY